MHLVIADALDAHEVAAIRDFAAAARFEDGRKTAGPHARDVKANAQATPTEALDGVLRKVEAKLTANPLFAAAATPRRIAGMLMSRYREGQTYGAHVDDAIMGGARTDLSFTLFLSDEDAYDGGALIIDDPLEARAIRLAPGDLILYPSHALHRVEPVTRGERLAIVGWVESWVRQAERREALFDLEIALNEIHARDGKSALFDRLAKTRTNLLRMWAGD
jgi:PKHD-type hydroxylase